jgi:sensor histidine kinase YesM
MDKAEGEIRISAEEEHEFLKFCVSDNGPGIEGKDREKISRCSVSFSSGTR